ncbi:HNH endonuclease signature motif containing protein [Pseudarthrobacter sp. PS3-L1]|uniref:HNH endonuclease signature motif containing protein n=1 Tax=Pseudarthrobacter sp. PS3-L1 TaxID=3046207 RepID=UPI0024BBD0F0|nr:HNH endonuclease signature motif containing protein [Pseudarthrobacter sp. PS3-L1]MDJ0321833.1 HNH endonuclease signature motif containing protein [Pseudarthrobacter sp. PS3-L1]
MNKRTCSYPGCERPHYGLGLCKPHHRQQWRGQELRPVIDRSLSPEQRLWNSVEKTQSCWLSNSKLTHDGYARVWVNGVNVYAHRFAYELLVGPIPEGLQIDHRCFVHNCVRPAHLRPATDKQNQEHLSGALRNSATGVRGVHWDKKNCRYVAQVRHNRKTIYLGRYDSIEEADSAARAKRAELFTHDDADY